ncbi:hypothetical protein sscle_16g110000 [Sclerotinia sclerotiorum 1980 UF-70]|uniref:Protein kinase domain-containing protein n=1 Tax=Sclerotinia sclerotiorum (strain ATCC 18683 / 1980 / Ss-1) TaxID=665079 RepID=A0A1D9QMT0_SCLS1|nr:hypothetical protein sscle_16g110000 [Sclerotinia sclerotiorum 1980 UF-70]
MDATEEAEIINSHPIKEGLVAFRRQFESSRAIEDILSAESASDLVLDLIVALQTFPAAHILCSPIDRKTRLRADLFSLGSKVASRDFDIKSTIPLMELVINNTPDMEIYPKRVTPPIAFEKAVFDTSLRSSSASQRGVEQTYDEVDQRILEELTGRVYYDIGGFYEQYFKGKSWTKNTRDIYGKSRAQYAESRWSGWPEPSLQGPFFKWFMKFQDTILSGLGRRYYTSANKVLRGSEADRKLDIFLTPADAVLLHGEHDWSNVLVIGEHKQNPDDDGSTKTLVQLAGYAREVFGSQPERRFVPGFTICGSMMRLWVFDRSGLYNSEKFDAHKEPERFIRVIAGYALMTDAELGLNTFVKHDGNSKYIVAQDCAVEQHVIEEGGATPRNRTGGRTVEVGQREGVTGIATWFNHEQIVINSDPDTISHFRRDMKFGRPRKLSSKASWVDGSPESSRAYSKTSLRGRSGSSASRVIGIGIGVSTSSSGQERKRNERLDRGSRLKRSKYDGSYASGTNVRAQEGELDTIGALSIQETVVDSLADCRNEWQRNNVDCIQEAGVDSFTDYECETYSNRVNYCLVTSPAGRSLREYQSVRELLEVLRDAIRGHRSLLEDGKILHRDISENNIITELPAEGDPKGRLIDLDLAKELDSMPSGARHRTGTMQFMAIEVLEGKGHTYRHDLESFFYVFLWICVRYGYEGTGRPKLNKLMRPKTNLLRGWYTGTYTEIARNKVGDMGKNRFENIIAEFAPKFENLKPLAREPRSILFPIRDGDIFTGTFHDSDIMYDRMIKVFDNAIRSIQNKE